MNPGMIKKIQQMQKDMMKAQKEIENSVFTGSAGGGAVEVTIKGTKEVLSIKIDEEVFGSIEDKEMVEEMLVIAVNGAMKEIDDMTEEKLGKFTQGMPGLF